MKSRILRPIESPDEPYMSDKRKARAQAVELSMAQYKTSLTPPSWPNDSAPDAVADRKLAQAETALDEVTQREQTLANQIKAHRQCVAQLAEERALLDAERIEHEKKVKLTEDTLLRTRDELALESEKLARQRESLDAAKQESARLATEAGLRKADRDANQFLPQLAKQAADLAALTETVAKVQQKLAQARAEHDATAKTRMEELGKREEALAQRESEAEKRFNTTTAQHETDLQSLERAQTEFAAAKKQHAE